jgi:hypothetical protein
MSPPRGTINQLLARGIPALSQATGGRSVNTKIEGRNFDMQVSFRPAIWPNSSNDNDFANRWLHSDVKNVAYYYTYMLFNKLVEEGELE